MHKNTWFSLLVCVNLALLTGIILFSYSPPAALAQGTGLAQNYMMVAGEIQNEHDALYIIDVRSRTIHAFIYDRGKKALFYSDSRELDRDFRNK